MSEHTTDKSKIFAQNLFPVVGIGASAGGLSAFKQFIKVIPGNSGMAYILMQNLHLEHEIALPEILRKETRIPVVEIVDSVHVEPDHIYVLPPNKLLVANGGILKIIPRPPDSDPYRPIDLFFSSLAEVHCAHAVGVVLSGTGTDGTEGMKDIKNQGGLTFVQEPASADCSDLPQSVIDAEIVDFVLSSELIVPKLVALKESFKIFSTDADLKDGSFTKEDGFRKVLALLRIRKGIDFTHYKQTIIRRCIIRRMVILHLEKIMDYVAYLKENEPEQDLLFRDLLIPVTSFFRDPQIFKALCEHVFPSLIKSKSAKSPLRIWVAGCSTGQEVYSIAMCLQEYLSDHVSKIKVQIFASDISHKAIAKAKRGLYYKKELEGISASRLLQFFNKKDGCYQVKESIRHMCVFACHNFLKGPPFAKVDLISCRNVLSCLEPFLQKKALAIFHYALREKGTLWLGKSETVGSASDLFMPYDKEEKLYTRKSIPGGSITVISESHEANFKEKEYTWQNPEKEVDDFQKSADAILLSKYTPAGVIVNEQFDIVQFRGSIRKFLEPSPGMASWNIFKMARQGLAVEIRKALQRSKISSKPFVKEGIRVNIGEKLVTIEVIPLPDTVEPYFLVLFHDTLPVPVGKAAVGMDEPSVKTNNISPEHFRIQQLENELVQNKGMMRSVNEGQEAANEEVLSGAGELQSLNEELQSPSEELLTVRQELHDSNEESEQNRLFADATIATLREPLLILDEGFIIKSANDSFYNVFQLSEDETLEKCLFELQDNGWEIPGLRKVLLKVIKEKEKLIVVEISHTFPSVGERTICFNIKPIYRKRGGQLILLALDDITRRRQAGQIMAGEASRVLKDHEFLHHFFMQTPAMLCILTGPEHTYEFANEPYRQLIGNRNPIGQPLKEVLPELGKDFSEILDKVYQTGETFRGKELPVTLARGGKLERVFVDFTYQAFNDKDGRTEGILVFYYDVTEQVAARNKIKESEERFRRLVLGLPIAVYTCDMDGYLKLYNEASVQLWGRRPEIGKDLWCGSWKLFTTDGKPLPLDECPMAIILKEGHIIHREMVIQRPDGVRRHVITYPQPEYDLNGKMLGAINTLIDVTEQVDTRRKIEASEKIFYDIANNEPTLIWVSDVNGQRTFFNKSWQKATGRSLRQDEGMGWIETVHLDDREMFLKKYTEGIEERMAFEIEYRLCRNDGVYRWTLSRGKPVYDSEGNFSGFLGVCHDIHDQKLMEQRKDDFISVASHEMKTPLSTAKAYLQLLEESMDINNEKVARYVKKAGIAIEKLNALISDLLDVSKIKQGKLNYNFTTFDFIEMVDSAIEAVQYASIKHTIIKSGEPVEEVNGDRDRLHQVVVNLLSNAIKYSPMAERVYINIIREKDNIKVSVKDEGIGISKDNLENIFEKYHRVKDPSMQSQGLGIGLFISYEIIQRHHGKLWVESEPRKGSIFYFTIPVVQ